MSPENSRYLAENIPGVQLLELSGADHDPWVATPSRSSKRSSDSQARDCACGLTAERRGRSVGTRVGLRAPGIGDSMSRHLPGTDRSSIGQSFDGWRCGCRGRTPGGRAAVLQRGLGLRASGSPLRRCSTAGNPGPSVHFGLQKTHTCMCFSTLRNGREAVASISTVYGG